MIQSTPALNNLNDKNRRYSKAEQNLRNHYFGLAQQVGQWCDDNSLARRVIGVTAGNSKVGVSTIALNLAIATAEKHDENVLLLQSDIGNPFAAHMLKTAGKPGFAELLQHQAELEDCIHETHYQRLAVMGIGKALKSDRMALPFQRATEFIDRLRETYSTVIVDLPRATPITPCFSIARQLDGVLLVVEQDSIEPGALQRTRDLLLEAKAKIVGVVINKRHD